MTMTATLQKRQDLLKLIEVELAPEGAVQGVVGIGSLANGTARPDSDIDAVVFLDPYDDYIVPAEFIWRAADRSFHSIFSEAPGLEEGIQFDLQRFDLTQWADPAFDWPEGRRAELGQGWLAFERSGRVTEMIAVRTAYPDGLRIDRMDDAIVWLDGHLAEGVPQMRWDSLGPVVAHDQLLAAYGFLVQALFAYNRRWRPWRNREMSALLSLPWLPENFAQRVLDAMTIPAAGLSGYLKRVESLRGLFQDLTHRLVAEGLYGENVVSEAFIRSHAEPGRAWNMDEWNQNHARRQDIKAG
jgi:predicted nucleotidyltransferase